MEQPNIPTQEGLNALYGAWNPMAYIQGQQNQGLADQFRQQAFNRNALDTYKVQQGVEQDSQMNPLLLDQQRGKNTELGFKNVMGGLEADRAKANQQNMLNADQRAAALKVSEDDMKKFEFHVGELMRSPDQGERDQGVKLQQYLAEFQKERRKHTDAMDVAKVGADASIRGHQISAGSAERIAKMNIDAGKFVRAAKGGKAVLSIQDAVQSGKMSAEQAVVALNSAAMFTDDEDDAKKYRELASTYEKLGMNFKNAQAGTKPDLGALGVPTNPVTPAIGSPTSPIVSSVPPQAAAHLKSNPALASAFDAKYGAGSAAKILGK